MPATAPRCAPDPFDGPVDIDAETRQLIIDLRDAARDGRALAARFAEVLKWTVDEYSHEFELRAEHLLAKLEASR